MTKKKTLLNAAGQKQATLDRAVLRIAPVKLDKPSDERHVNAAMPDAPQGYKWPHLQTPARFL